MKRRAECLRTPREVPLASTRLCSSKAPSTANSPRITANRPHQQRTSPLATAVSAERRVMRRKTAIVIQIRHAQDAKRKGITQGSARTRRKLQSARNTKKQRTSSSAKPRRRNCSQAKVEARFLPSAALLLKLHMCHLCLHNNHPQRPSRLQAAFRSLFRRIKTDSLPHSHSRT